MKWGTRDVRLTPECLAAAYDFLRTASPFDKWNLPEAEDVHFAVLRGATRFGDCGEHLGKPCIRVSEGLHGRYTSVLVTMAHEMIHVHMDAVTCVSKHAHLRTDNRTHGPAFRAFAAQVCKNFPEFDPVVF